MALGLDHLDELPALPAQLVQRPLRASLRPDPEHVILEAASGGKITLPALLLLLGAGRAFLVRPQQSHRPTPYRAYHSTVDEIGLFPLGTVLLPTERIPLHIFEPRYRELIGECIDEGREFGLILADDDGLREVGTRAVITDVLERFEDGRLNVIVEGRERFKLVGLTSGRSFKTGEVEPLLDGGGNPDPSEVDRALALLRRLGEIAGADVESVSVETSAPSFELAARVEFEPRIKQALLEQRSEPERLKTLSQLLERAAHLLELQQAGNRIAQTNGRVGSAPSA
jgi:Lon protease-like protein